MDSAAVFDSMAHSAHPPTRQSCDRCHRQKLRCRRASSKTLDACERCHRKGVECLYSTSLPKGRPSVYRLNENQQAARRQVPESTSSSLATYPALSELNSVHISPESLVMPMVQPQHNQSFGDPNLDWGLQNNCMSLSIPMHKYTDACMQIWQDAPGNGERMIGLTPDSALTSNIDPLLEAPTFQPPHPTSEIAERPPAEESDDNASSNFSRDEIFSEADEADENEHPTDKQPRKRRNCSQGNMSFAADQSSFRLNVLDLSRLSTQLSQLLGSSRGFLSEVTEVSPNSGVDCSAEQARTAIRAVFTSVNAWLTQGSVDLDPALLTQANSGPSSPSDLLPHIFSASNQVMKILHQLREDVMTPKTSSAQSTASSSGRQNSISSCYTQPAFSNANSSIESLDPSSGDGSSRSYGVIHQLVVVCLTLLLNMHIVILIALQRGADALCEREDNNGTRSDQLSDKVSQPIDCEGQMHLQLVSLVQMCSYFIQREDQGLDMLVLNGLSSYVTESLQTDVCKLRVELKQRLEQLRARLGIVI